MKPNRVRHENQTQKEESKIVRKSEGSVGVVVYVFFFFCEKQAGSSKKFPYTNIFLIFLSFEN